MTAQFIQDLRKLVDATPVVDTHEHLYDEAVRIQGLADGEESGMAAPDFSLLFRHYTDSDLIVSGMGGELAEKFFGYGLSVQEKWKLVAPYFDRIRHTGYGQMVTEAIRISYGEYSLNADTVESISKKIRNTIQPGFYKKILQDTANIEYCQVDSIEPWEDKPEYAVFRNTSMPGFLTQDLSTLALATGPDVENLPKHLNRDVGSLQEYLAMIDWIFDECAPRAIATKNQCAYGRGLDFEQVGKADAAPLFNRYVKDQSSLTAAELKTVQDYLFHYCIEKATEYDLPVKLHTGYYAGHASMPLNRVRKNAGDVCDLLRAHPDTRFDFFHICYPYQDEIIAVAKQWPNAWVDMCWAWIINPAASVRFLKEFLMAAPCNKLLSFGGDLLMAEAVVGHAAIARKGITQALAELVQEGWLSENDLEPLVERLLRGNAHELFDYEGKLKAWA